MDGRKSLAIGLSVAVLALSACSGAKGESAQVRDDGADSSRSKAPQIVAESPADHLAVDIRLGIEPAGGAYSSMIEVTVSSGCFRGQSPDTA
ncbi:hypothetical protein ACFXKR_17195 [Streptomyces violascens]|uniref:hypothetical protein n=1 Tax=Streptomyces violascens TaxID=67381 RepID=UPI00367A4A46